MSAGGRARAFLAEVPRAELRLVVIAMALSAAVVIAYVVARHPLELRGDMVEYHSEGVFFTEGRPWWTTLPFGIAHEGMWKAPLYPAWVGLVYELFGARPSAVGVVQGLILAPLAVLGTWLLGRRLFGPAVGVIGAAIVAVFPLAWEYYGLLYPEAFAIPLALAAFWLLFERPPTSRLAIGLGALVGVSILVRPTSFFILAGCAAAWVLAAGWLRGLALTALATALAALVVAPWTVRNYVVADALIPVSLQDIAAYGVFNEDSAGDPVRPYAWRYRPADVPAVLAGPPVDDGELRSELQREALDYIAEHPESLPQAWFWNGVSRFWDLRRPARPIEEAPLEGRSRAVAIAGITIYYALLVLAAYGLWRIRARRAIVVPIAAMALAASLIFIVGSGTRYRAPLEPLVVLLAVNGALLLGRAEPRTAGALA